MEISKDDPEYNNNLGLAYASTGKKDQAEHYYRLATDLKPDYAEAYRNLIAMKKISSLDDGDYRQIKKLWDDGGLNDANTAKLAFALGKIYDDCAMFAEAFDHYHLGNQLKMKETEIDFDAYFSHIDRVVDVFRNRPHCAIENEHASQPIFILGMPRSGTTLVEQILSRHPEVESCGELPCIERAITRLEQSFEQPRIYPDEFLSIDCAQFAAEVGEYFNWVDQIHDIGTGFFTDKMPFNFVHVWLVKTLFPNSAIVHCHRHPLDVITSNYFQLYGSEVNFVYDLNVLARYYVRYYRLMQYWHNLFPGEIYKIQYEALVSDHEAETRKLIENVGLPWNENCLDHKIAKSTVRTASIWQVRQGIYTSSKERWRHYRDGLQPAIDVLLEEKILDEEMRYIE